MRTMLNTTLLVLTLLMPVAAAAETTHAVLQRIADNAHAAHSDAVLIRHDRNVLLESSTHAEAEPIQLMSATKSIVALAIGLLLDDGRLDSLDTPVSTVYPEWQQGQKRDITVRMLLEHTSGLQNVPNAGEELEGSPDLVALALAAEVTSPPGTRFAYNNKATNLLPGLVERLAGRPIDGFLQERIFSPLGIHAPTWLKDRAGTPMGMAGLLLSARDLAAIGQMMLDRGLAPDGTRVLSEHAVALMSAESARSADVGLLWWRIPAWERYTLKIDAAAVLEKHGVSSGVQQALLSTRGATFASKAELIGLLAERLGPEWPQQYGTEITGRGIALADLFTEERGPVLAFAANGYLGQHLLIVPGKRVVAVRQINRHATHASPLHDYSGFPADVLRLAATLPDRQAD